MITNKYERPLIAEADCRSDMHALVTGSFDPVTVGHMDVIERAAKQFGKVTAVVFVNPDKEYLLSLAEKSELLRLACRHLPNVQVMSDTGMVCDFCIKHKVDVIVRGVRGEQDMDFEQRCAAYNYEHSGVPTLLLQADARYRTVSSSALKQKLRLGESVGDWLPDGVEEPFLNMLLQQL